jgi:hypothetical protein
MGGWIPGSSAVWSPRAAIRQLMVRTRWRSPDTNRILGLLYAVKKDAMSFDWSRVRDGWALSQRAAEASASPDDVSVSDRWRENMPVVPIAITGLRGAGKTVLSQALTDQIGNDYKLPRQSETPEKYLGSFVSQTRENRYAVVVVPAQGSTTRSETVDQIFQGSSYPDGIIHVVCWGYNKVWAAHTMQSLFEEKRKEHPELSYLDFVRNQNLQDELKDFQETARYVRRWWSEGRRVWFVLAVAKSDLYWPRINDVRDYYLPRTGDRGSRFCDALRDLVDPFADADPDGQPRVAAIPVSCYRDPYGAGALEPSLNDDGTAALVHRFRAVIEGFCKHG